MVFKNHRTHAAFATFKEKGVHIAWKQACIDNSKSGDPRLPAFVKAAMEVLGVLLIALYGLKRWRFVAVLAVLLLAQTASEEQSSGGGGGEIISEAPTCSHPSWAVAYDLGVDADRCTLCGARIVDPTATEGSQSGEGCTYLPSATNPS